MVAAKELSTKRRLWTVLKRILISCLIFILLDLLAGFVLIKDNFQSFRTQHHYFHHGLLPNTESMAAWGTLVYPFYTNSLGFVDSANYDVPLISENERLVILGDSHSEGVGVPYLKTFAGRLATQLKEDGVDVLNASCISYSQKIEYLKARYIIEEQGLKFDHLFILVDISDMQNELVYEKFIPSDNSFSKRAGIAVKSFLRKRSAIYSMVYKAIQGKRSERFFETAQVFEGSTPENSQSNSLELYSTFFSDFDDNTLLSNPQFHGVSEWYYDDYFTELADVGITMAQDQMRKLKKLCDQHTIKLTISIHPWQTQILKGEQEDYYTNKWESFCRQEQINFISLFPLFITSENPVLVNKMYYIKDDNHWNEFGHQKVADYLYEFISNDELKADSE